MRAAARKVTPREASLMFGVCTKTLARWDAEGKIRALRTPGGHRRYYLSEITAMIGEEPPAPDA
jgi:putative resolvase